MQATLNRMINVWDERRVFGNSGVKPFTDVVSNAKTPARESPPLTDQLQHTLRVPPPPPPPLPPPHLEPQQPISLHQPRGWPPAPPTQSTLQVHIHSSLLVPLLIRTLTEKTILHSGERGGGGGLRAQTCAQSLPGRFIIDLLRCLDNSML